MILKGDFRKINKYRIGIVLTKHFELFFNSKTLDKLKTYPYNGRHE